MAWADVEVKIKFYGVDGQPATVNGLLPYGGAFSSAERTDILRALDLNGDGVFTEEELLWRGQPCV